MAHYRLVIVGAGLAGLTAARDVLEDATWDAADIAIVESGPSVGGRLATNRIGDAVFDHGAQFFTVRSPAFRDRVDRWLAEGVVEEWCRGFAEVDGYPRYRATGGMQSLARHLADGLRADGVSIAVDTTAALTLDKAPHWTVFNSGEAITADSVILTPPVPVSRGLLTAGRVALAADVDAALHGFDYHRVIALLAVLDGPTALEPPGALQQPDHPTFSFVADNQAKGVSPHPCVTFHIAHGRSAELWSLPDAEVVRKLVPEAEAVVAPAHVTDVEVRRWRYAGPVTPFADPCLVAATEPGLLVLAGDGFGGSKVEGAFSSGLAAATTIRADVA